MNELQIITQREVLGKDFTIYGDAENPLFLAKDVAEWIEHSNSTVMLDSVDIDEKLVMVPTKDCLVGDLQVNTPYMFLTEDGLYEVLMQSRKPIAKQFKSKVKEILKDIRKTGGYIPVSENESDEDIMAKAYIIAKRTLAEKEKRISGLKEQIELDKPKVIFADSVAVSHTTILIGELAKILRQNGIEIGQNRLFEQLRNQGYLIRRKGADWNMPTQRSVELGLFKIKETTRNHADGHTSIDKVCKVTGKGQLYFINKFLKQ